MVKKNPKDEAQKDKQNPDEEKTPFEKFDDLMTKLLDVPKEELDEKRAEYERKKKGKKQAG